MSTQVMTQTVTPTTTPNANQTATAPKKTVTAVEKKKRKSTPAKSKHFTPFHGNIRKLQKLVSHELSNNPHQVGARQTGEASLYMNAIVEEYLKNVLDFTKAMQDTNASVGHAGNMGQSFKTLMPNHLEAFIRVKHAPENADLIMQTIQKHRADNNKGDSDDA